MFSFVTYRLQLEKLVLHLNLKIMETSSIQKLDKSRYNLIKWLLISWILWFGGFILKDFISNKLIELLINLITIFGCVMWIRSTIQLRIFSKIVNSDSHLKKALNDELALFNRSKSLVVGYWTLIILAGIFFVLSIFTNISAVIVSELILYIGIISPLLSSLIYNKD